MAAAYSVSPTSQGWNADAGSKYYQLLKDITGLKGLAPPFLGTDKLTFIKVESTDEDLLAGRVRERGMRKFKSMSQAQRFLSAHAEIYN